MMNVARQPALCHLSLYTAICKKMENPPQSEMPKALRNPSLPWGKLEFVLLLLGRRKFNRLVMVNLVLLVEELTQISVGETHSGQPHHFPGLLDPQSWTWPAHPAVSSGPGSIPAPPGAASHQGHVEAAVGYGGHHSPSASAGSACIRKRNQATCEEDLTMKGHQTLLWGLPTFPQGTEVLQSHGMGTRPPHLLLSKVLLVKLQRVKLNGELAWVLHYHCPCCPTAVWQQRSQLKQRGVELQLWLQPIPRDLQLQRLAALANVNLQLTSVGSLKRGLCCSDTALALLYQAAESGRDR